MSAQKSNASVTTASARKPLARPGQPGGKRDLRRKERTEALLDAGLNLFLERGIEGATIDDLVRGAGTAKGNFYRYFSDKTALVQALVDRIGEELVPAMSACEKALKEAKTTPTLFAAYSALGQRMASLAETHPLTIRLYLQESRSPAVGAREPIVRLARDITERAVALSKLGVDYGLISVSDPRVSALVVVGAVEQLMLASLQGELQASRDETWGILIRVVLEGTRAQN
jgi:AcrR family transcriptional regulator